MAATGLEFDFMRRAAFGSLLLALGAAPVGVFLMLRRMSLMGDAMYLLAGLSLPAMTVGGVIGGLIVAGAAGVVARHTVIREDAALAAFYLVSLALGVLIISVRGSQVDLLHVLFGSVLALDDAVLALLAGVALVTVGGLAVLWRPLVMECVDPAFLRGESVWGAVAHHGFLALVVGHQPGGGLSRPGHSDGRGHDGAAGRQCALLVPPIATAAGHRHGDGGRAVVAGVVVVVRYRLADQPHDRAAAGRMVRPVDADRSARLVASAARSAPAPQGVMQARSMAAAAKRLS